jgi:PEP-CTERM motif
MFFFTAADQMGGSFTASGSGIGTFSGSGTIVSPFVPSGMNMSVLANINVNAGPSVTDLTASVPASSMDFNAIAAPEPATGGLFGAALVALGWAFHRRKK